ncbi:coenzyme PQQ synthesis protein E [Streptomyces mashuensis]|uniref:Coenzyme PQQ synthesis protein E n=1 Tax=Streptomyces mashuensis TaxID=33904 RepID=A0A919AYZ5_9ACTN|nr:radical SAM protein [Streptomyces mashuensis]GHF33506.1 coenzyme PQQ synthesis protein E [Streptomyces mashuensis]
MTDLGMPAIPASRSQLVTPGLAFSNWGHHFTAEQNLDLKAAVKAARAPLSVIVQVTKRCNFGCSFCSETLQIPDPTLKELELMRLHLAGVPRIFLSGGEPLMRKDFGEIVDMYYEDHILAVPTNATHGLQHAKGIAGKIAFANIGLEGPRTTTTRVRGNYDQIMAGVHALKDAGIPLSLSAVVYRSTLSALPFTCQIADVLEAGKVKLIMPLRKGNALDLDENEFISDTEAAETFARLSELRTIHGWRPALRMTTWTPENEGHMIVIEPNGVARAWPVYDAPDLWERLGNVLEEPIEAIWERYRFKENHFAKYLGRSIRTTTHTEAGR